VTTPSTSPEALSLACGGTGCTNPVAVQWRRRLTSDELAAIVAAEEQRRQAILLLSDPEQPAPVFGPMPTAETSTRAVHACGQHSLGLDLAAHIHASTCTAPNNGALPGCDCTPEPLPAPPAPPQTVTLATGWTIQA
jgi:hypothetical protein